MEQEEPKSRRQLILDYIEDEIGGFLYYYRKNDSNLPEGDIEDAIAEGEITVDEIVAEFSRLLRESLES